jgi:hypothetical protein
VISSSAVNWIAAYNRLFALLDKRGEVTYHSGPAFLRMAQHVDIGVPSYESDFPFYIFFGRQLRPSRIL